jgi:3-isopropylmalate/(R)-2-methylmalate dehydratase large subunit
VTIVEDIIAAHAGRDNVRPGDLATVKVDRVYLQDGNSPTIRQLFGAYGFDRVFDPDRVGIFFDHSVIAPDKHIANRLREAMDFAERLGVRVFRAGAGISHVVALEIGWFEPGTIVIGSDSHTCTGGATQCLALGMGASDAAAAMVTGETWLRVPDTVWLNVTGEPNRFCTAKDVVLHVLANQGQERFIYKSVEWAGSWAERLSLDSAATVANLGVELGAKIAFLPPGPGRPAGMRPVTIPAAGDPRRIEIDIAGLPPMVALPNSPSNGVPIDECRGQKIDYVFVGSCTNSRLEDIAEVARVLGKAPVHPRVHCLVSPGSQQVYLDSLERGYIDTLTRAGAIVTPPGCSACLGTQGSIPASGDRVLSTMNRNFLGRMGNAEAQIYLASPVVAAHTAVRGEIPRLTELA